MIFEAISCIEKALNDNLPPIRSIKGNIGDIIAANKAGVEDDIVISLINIEENRISRDPRNYIKSGTDMLLKNPAVHLNLTLLFSAIRTDGNAYEGALQNLQAVILFFQGKSVFDHTNTIGLDPGIEKLLFEMVSVNTEQLNNFWAILGGRYQPSVIYKMRMITIDSVTDQHGSLIKEIETNYHSITSEE